MQAVTDSERPTAAQLTELLLLGRHEEALQLCRVAWDDAARTRMLTDLTVSALQERDLSAAGQFALTLAALQRGSRWYPKVLAQPPARAPQSFLTLPKLRHDIAQLRHLREVGVLDSSFDAVIEQYIATCDRLRSVGDNTQIPFTEEDERRIGSTYGRIVHLSPAPRLSATLSPLWDRRTAEHRFRKKPGVVVIDDFLTPQALGSLRRFCLESTCWSGNRYANGRLGAFFLAGFNCPLLLQIAEEIRDALPDIIGSRYPLRHLWAFKNTGVLPADSTIHADFAAVNVNFWITPDEANLDDSSGGMVIYDSDAPLSWDFATYNERVDTIREYLRTQRAGVIRVPYRQNRAVIFNSDLFHATEGVRFRPEYVNHRINVTMLYGERGLDQHHPPAHLADTSLSPYNAWRSSAFTRSRTRAS
jgi:hypothetical protein